jgi:hypothetical protein
MRASPLMNPYRPNNRIDAYRLYEACKDILNNYIVQDADLFKVSNSVYINGNEINVDRLDPKYYTYFQSKLYKTFIMVVVIFVGSH